MRPIPYQEKDTRCHGKFLLTWVCGILQGPRNHGARHSAEPTLPAGPRLPMTPGTPSTPPTPEIERIRGVLTAAGHTWTRPRAGVLEVLVSAATPLKAEEIHARLRRFPRGRGINLSTVYRTLNLLRTLDVVRRVQLGDGAQRCELAEGYRAHHHHLVCETCGRIEDVGRCPIEGADLGVPGRVVRAHHLELFGVCGDCAAGEAPRHARA